MRKGESKIPTLKEMKEILEQEKEQEKKRKEDTKPNITVKTERRERKSENDE